MIAEIGAVFLSLCAVPQAWCAVYRPRTTRALSWPFLAMWGGGEAMLLIGLWDVVGWPVLVNYGVNALLVAVIAAVKWDVSR